MKKPLNYLLFAVLFLLPLLFYQSIDKSGWISSSDVHALLEFSSSLLALTAGVMVLLYFFTTGLRFYLIISVGFFLVGTEELIHSVFSFTRLWVEMSSNNQLAISATWLSGQLVLATSFFLAFFSGDRKIEEAKRKRYSIVFISIGVLIASAVSLMIFNFPSLPEFVQLGSISKKLIELSLALLFIISFVLFFSVYSKQKTHNLLLRSILLFLILRVLVHIFVFDSKSFYDAHWDIAHLIVLLSYFFPVFGVWGETVRIHKEFQLQLIEFENEMAKRKQVEEALVASEEEFRSLAESMPQMVWTTRADGWNTYFNQQWVDYTGLTPEESYGHGWNIPFHPEDKQRAWDAWQNAVNNNAEYSIDCRIRRYDGTYHWWLVRGVPQHGANGEILKWFGTCTDIERIKQVESNIRESEEKYRNLFNNSEVGIFRTRLDGSEVLEVNEKYLKILGYTIEEVRGKPSENLWVNKHKREKMEEQIEAEGQVVDLECELLTREGKVKYCIASFKLYRDTGILEGSILDITDRKLAEKTLRENEERLRDIIFSIVDWVWEVDENGIYMYSSQKGFDLFGRDIIGKTPFDFMPADEAKRVGEIFSELAAKKAPIKDLENWKTGKNGERICLLTNGVPLLDKEGNLKGYRGVDKDITRRMKIEEDFRESEQQYRELIDGMIDTAWVIDFDGNLLDVNQAAVEVLGYSQKELFTIGLYGIDSSLKKENIMALVNAMPSVKLQVFETSHRTKEGKIIPVEISSSLITYHGEKAILSVARNIAERKHTQEELLKMKQSLENLNQRLFEIRENERALISRNIHDQLGQSLTSLKFDLGTIINQTESGSDEEVKLKGMIGMVTQIIRDVQRISSELRPPALDELGLAAAMEWYCEDFIERTGLKLHMELDDVQTRDMDKNLALYRVLQESLTNVIRHSSAKNVLVKLCVFGKGILLIIKDDGIGITPDKIVSFKSLGILGMFERIRQYGGDVEITNPDKKGTEVKVRLLI